MLNINNTMTFSDFIAAEEEDLAKDTQDNQTLIQLHNQLESKATYWGKKSFSIFSKDDDDFETVWRVGGTGTAVPYKRESFYQQFPRKASNLDGEYHNSDLTFYTRWFPNKWFVDFIKKILDSKTNLNQSNEQLTAFPVPTKIEVDTCDNLKGVGVWDRKGIWKCLSKHSKINLNLKDIQGPKYFTKYGEYLGWKNEFKNAIKIANEAGKTKLANRLQEKFDDYDHR